MCVRIYFFVRTATRGFNQEKRTLSWNGDWCIWNWRNGQWQRNWYWYWHYLSGKILPLFRSKGRVYIMKLCKQCRVQASDEYYNSYSKTRITESLTRNAYVYFLAKLLPKFPNVHTAFNVVKNIVKCNLQNIWPEMIRFIFIVKHYLHFPNSMLRLTG